MRDEGFSHRDRCAIVGIGATEFSKDSGRSELSLATEASAAALADAGLTVADVDGLVKCDHDNVTINALADSLGAELSYWAEVGPGGRGSVRASSQSRAFRRNTARSMPLPQRSDAPRPCAERRGTGYSS